jgi:hypothetical protein
LVGASVAASATRRRQTILTLDVIPLLTDSSTSAGTILTDNSMQHVISMISRTRYMNKKYPVNQANSMMHAKLPTLHEIRVQFSRSFELRLRAKQAIGFSKRPKPEDHSASAFSECLPPYERRTLAASTAQESWLILVKGWAAC